MDNNKTDNYFRERLGNFEQSPPDAGWDNIARKLADRRKKRVFMLVFRIAAGMAILLSTGLGVYLISKQNTVVTDNSLQETLSEKIANQPGTISGSEEQASSQMESAGSGNETATILAEKSREVTAANKGIRETGATNYDTKNYGVDEQQNTTTNDNDVIPNDHRTLLAHLDGRLDVAINQFISGDLPVQARQLSAEESAALLLADYYDDEEKDKDENGKRWSLGSEVAPLYSYRSIKSEQYSSAVIDNLNESESGILAYAGGLQVSYDAGKRISIQSGVYYSRYGQQKNQVEQVSGNTLSNSGNYKYVEVANSTGNITGTANNRSDNYSADFFNLGSGMKSAEVYPLVQGDVENVTFEQLFDYFEVPLIMKVKIIDRKMDFSFSGGLVTNFLVGNTVNMVDDGKSTKITETAGINKVNYQGSVGMGLEYPVSSSFALTLEPRFRYYINPIGSSPTINVRPFSFGFFAGINYRF